MAHIEAADRRRIGPNLAGAQPPWRSFVEPLTLQTLAAHLLALGVVMFVSLTGPPGAQSGGLVAAVIAGGFAVLHVASARRRLTRSTLALDAIGMALLLAGTGAGESAYVFLAMAAAWWAANLPLRHSGAIWALAFAVAYAALAIPLATTDSGALLALEDAATLVIIGVLGDWIGRVDARAIALSEALAAAPAGADKVAIRDGLSRALPPMEISLDVLLSASRQGLTVIQAELLAYLVLGLTNQEIADATKVSVATVRYRLTRLYRALGVQGRKAAVARAAAIGLSASGIHG